MPMTQEQQIEEGVWITGPDGELIPDYDATFPTINEGEVVHGTVVRVDKDEVLVDIGYKSEGVIPVSELSIRRSVNPADEVSVGDEIDALVLTKEDAEGRLILSKKRARFELAWKAIEAAHERGEPVTGRVIEVVKGGLILDLGVRGFLPASLVDIRRVQDLDEFMGKELRSKVIELNRSRNNVVLSRRAVLEDERKEQRQQILDRLNPGDVVEGQISNIVDFGAFVDLDGMDGLIHISELSWSHVNHPSEVLEIGQNVQVKVLDIDRDRQRISLGWLTCDQESSEMWIKPSIPSRSTKAPKSTMLEICPSTTKPGCTISRGFSTWWAASSEMWTRPSTPSRISTKAPKVTTFVTRPSTTSFSW